MRASRTHLARALVVGLALLLVSGFAVQADPDDKPKAGTFALTNARIVTVSGPVIESGTVVIQDGKIAAVGASVTIPDGAEIIDCEGMEIYPGMIDSGTSLGLREVSAVPTTVDSREIGDVKPQMMALTAVNPNSVSIPVTRVDGVTTVLTAPTGGLITGQAALINLVGYTPAQMDAGFAAPVLDFPATGRRGRFDRRTDKEVEEAAEKALTRLNEVWDEATVYAKIDSARAAGATGPEPVHSPELKALIPAVRGDAKVIVNVNAAKDIQAALKWIEKRGVDAILSGVAEGWRVADEIAASGIPCLVGPVIGMPTRSSDRYDKAYANPGIMHAAGVKLAIMSDDTENSRRLPFHAGFAVAYGMDKDDAIRAITLTPAEIFGVADQLGSIEVGKAGTLIVTGGDPLEARTAIHHVFIDGYQIPMTSRHTRLYDEFLERSPGLKK